MGAATGEEKARRGHPLLRGVGGSRRDGYTHGFSASQMAALTALCGAFVPSLPPPGRQNGRHHSQQQEKEEDGDKKGAVEVEEFFLASAGDPPVPDEVAQLMSRMCLPEALALVRTVLWLLSTRLGSLALCGAACCLSWRFPFLRRFNELPLEEREAAMRRWSRQTMLPPLRMFFLVTKVFCLYAFYSMIDENSENPHWRAIGYSPPVDEAPEEEEEEEEKDRSKKRPLDDGVVETINETDASLPASLQKKGLTVTEDAARNALIVECDAVVVGSGCGGGVAAAVLAEAGYKVVVIEKGSYFTSRDYTTLEGPSMAQLYEAGGFVSTLSGSTLILAGATVGGGSAVNWSACIKTPDNVRKEWAGEHGIGLFVSPEYGAAMDAVFERIGVTHGCTEEGLQNKVLRKGCEKLGYEVQSVARNSSEGHYCGSCGYGCRTGDKRGTDTTWLVDAVTRGAVVLTGCKAEKLLLLEQRGDTGSRAQRCVGVVARSTNPAITRTVEVRARVTVSACGSLLTPVLLRGSGLRNPHIGRNLHLHPTVLVWGYFPDDDTDDTERDLSGLKAYEGGIITSLHKTMEGRAIIETPAVGVAGAGTQFPWVSGRDMKERMLRYGRTVHLFSLVRDRGSGAVHGERRVAYHMDATDREAMRAGMRRALRVLAAAGAAEIGTHRSDGQRFACAGATEQELEAFLDGVDVVRGPQSKAEAWSLCCSAHQMGSCRMGAAPENGAVDARGESWEAEGLYVCDGSVLPGAVGVNPMVTIQSVAYCLATGIVESLKREELAS